MVLTYLRRNAVAYLALIVALSAGTAYAAGLANGSVTSAKLAKNAVTSPKIKANAVRTGDVKNRSLKAVDLAAGVVPRDAEVVVRHVFGAGDPPAAPDLPGVAVTTTPADGRAGTAYLRVFSGRAGITCSSGPSYAGLYIDDAPVPETYVPISPASSAAALEVLAVIPVSAGAHELSLGLDCPSGDDTGNIAVALTFTMALLAE